ncbi:ribonuclease H family protein [Bacillus wiedmannii]
MECRMKDYIDVWTDGSCDNKNNEFGGVGIVMNYKSHNREISKAFGGGQTNNTMEMMAVVVALENIATTNIPIKIHSDSAYVVNCFLQKWYVNWRKNGWKNSKKKAVENKDIWERMIELVEKQKDVEFVKVKGHIGIPLNERCDQLAKSAVKKAREKKYGKEAS